ncbi:hypothetical protein H2201_008883 [Coniosporium apollinis]|uniref:Uncharacterized protein n=1 Tax=Coniosporium apollinis TaxID=61459 RepID=A0ABQ9NFK9_9PEZI|nr:hypothetical protein H2201_008883 [Coniosporium apollinis]
METDSIPRISASLSVDPATYSFANSQAPNLTLTITSHHPDPITIYAEDLSPKLMLTCGALTITDLTTGSEVRQSKRTHCRIPPPCKVAVPLNEHVSYTLLLNTPLTLSAPFTRNRMSTGGKPLAKHDQDYDNDHSAKHGACGVDGLESRHRYALSLSSKSRVPWDVIRWWEYGTKEQVLNANGDGAGLDGRRVQFSPGPHKAIVVDSSSTGVVELECRA